MTGAIFHSSKVFQCDTLSFTQKYFDGNMYYDDGYFIIHTVIKKDFSFLPKQRIVLSHSSFLRERMIVSHIRRSTSTTQKFLKTLMDYSFFNHFTLMNIQCFRAIKKVKGVMCTIPRSSNTLSWRPTYQPKVSVPGNETQYLHIAPWNGYLNYRKL